MENVSLSSERILLRSIKESDAEAIFAYRSLKEVAKYQYWEPFTKEQTTTFVNNNKDSSLEKREEWIGLVIIHKKDCKLIGDCSLRIGAQSAEIGCNISPEYQNKGFAKEVLNILFEYTFKHTPIEEVFGITDSENKASIQLMESLGMSKSADFEERLICKGVLSIEHKYAIKKSNLYQNLTGKDQSPYPSNL